MLFCLREDALKEKKGERTQVAQWILPVFFFFRSNHHHTRYIQSEIEKKRCAEYVNVKKYIYLNSRMMQITIIILLLMRCAMLLLPHFFIVISAPFFIIIAVMVEGACEKWGILFRGSQTADDYFCPRHPSCTRMQENLRKSLEKKAEKRVLFKWREKNCKMMLQMGSTVNFISGIKFLLDFKIKQRFFL